MDYAYIDDEAVEASDLSCLVKSPIGNLDDAMLDFSDSLPSIPKSGFLDKVRGLLGKKPSSKTGKTLLQQIQCAHPDDRQEIPSAYRKTTRVWAFKIIPFKEASKK